MEGDIDETLTCYWAAAEQGTPVAAGMQEHRPWRAGGSDLYHRASWYSVESREWLCQAKQHDISPSL